MAFSEVFIEKEVIGGLVYEKHTWNGASVTSGTITCDTTTQPEIANIMYAIPSNDADHATIVALDTAPNVAKLTFTSSDTGTLYIVGKAR